MSRRASREEALAHALNVPCVMCCLADEARSPDDLVAADAHTLVRLDRLGASHGHLMVILRAHETAVESLPWDAYEALQRAAWRASRVLAEVVSPRRVWVASLGSPDPLPMSCPHLHVHVVPVHGAGEETRPARVFSWAEGVTVYDDDEARALVSALRARWREVSAR